MSSRPVFGIPITMDIPSIFSSGCEGWSISICDVEVYQNNQEDYVVNTNRSKDFISAATLTDLLPTSNSNRSSNSSSSRIQWKREGGKGQSMNRLQRQPGERRITLENFVGEVKKHV